MARPIQEEITEMLNTFLNIVNQIPQSLGDIISQLRSLAESLNDVIQKVNEANYSMAADRLQVAKADMVRLANEINTQPITPELKSPSKIKDQLYNLQKSIDHQIKELTILSKAARSQLVGVKEEIKQRDDQQVTTSRPGYGKGNNSQ